MRQYQVSFWDAIRRAFTKYCVFTGRASRSEFWWFYLFTQIVGIVLVAPVYGTLIQNIANGVAEQPAFTVWNGVVYLWSLFILLPYFGLLFRRLHDTGRSGWNWLWLLLPVIGTIIIIVYLCTESQPFPNKYGEVPNLESESPVY